MPVILAAEQPFSQAVLELNLVTASFAAFLIGTYVSIFLYGLSVHQAYRYLRSFPKDARYIRWLVISVILLETVHFVETIDICYHYLVLNYHRPDTLTQGTWSLLTLPLFTGLVTITAQTFFIRRVSLITARYRIVVAVVVLCLVAELGFTLVATAALFLPSFSLRTATILSAAAILMAGIADTSLTIVIVVAIRRSRKGRPRPESESWIDVLQLYLVNSGVATGVFNLLSFIAACALPPAQTLVALSLGSISTRLYANTLLAVLNSRQQRGMEFVVDADRKLSIAEASVATKLDLWNAPQLPEASAPRKISIQVRTENEGSRHI
ncbi:hypothetical protein LXA43DRAFT_753854 [Ganoderma leucocontextum]|nr:hypothetical protein LXA43DRAFT_753854 [Ganoderma leucocontextum]